MAFRKISKEQWKEIWQEFIRSIKNGLTVEEACAYIGVNKSTIYRKLEKDEKLATEFKNAKIWQKAWIKAQMNSIFNKLVEDGNYAKALQHLQWKAERLMRDEFATKQIVEDVTEKKRKEKDEILKVVLELSNEDRKKDKNKKDSK